VPVDDDHDIETNPDLDQHFLVDPAKLVTIIDAADIQPTDHVVEVGAGIGTVAEHVPACQSLTAIEYDAKLAVVLARRVPHARVIEGDALAILPGTTIDVLLSNLPADLTPALVSLLPKLDFRVALLTVPSLDALAPLEHVFTRESVTVLAPDDFRPPQLQHAEVVRLTRKP
jgi:16S rRNA A1518/A1519 N6-dimethyltransferase RsmA/KsgA/DIM1 with predicted DNA glycosylase/AP lyase activity